MRTPAAAIAWEFRQRHRLGLLALVGALFALAALRVAVRGTPAYQEFHDVTFALLLPVPLAAAFFYLLAVFTFGVSGDVAARESMYPQRMLTLPVSSAALAGWPMLYGCLSMMTLWFAIRSVGMFPPGFDPPRFWPALFGASLVAWTQALMWMPYPLRGLRVGVAVVLLVTIDVVVFAALEGQAGEATMLLLLAPLVPLAFVTARSAVARARRGEVPEWPLARRFTLLPKPGAATSPFAAPARAQFWFEWRSHGRTLPVMVAIVLPAALSLLFLFRNTPAIVVEIVITSLLLPPFLAMFVAATAGESSASASAASGMSPFLATRPVDDRALVVAKWQAALLSTLVTGAIVAIAVPVALLWADAAGPIVDIARKVEGALGAPRAVLLAILVVAILAGSTWKQLVQGLYVAISGSERAVKGIAFATLALVSIGVLVLGWILDSRYRFAVAWSVVPWVMVVLAGLKLALAALVMHRGAARGVFTRGQLIRGVIAWDLCVFALYGVLAVIIPAILVRRDFLLLTAMLVVPFVRVAAAPVAVARSRHR